MVEITGWHERMTPRDYAALTPQIWEHVNPYGRFDLDMNGSVRETGKIPSRYARKLAPLSRIVSQQGKT